MVILRFTSGKGIAGRIVQAFTWSWCAHVDFELDDGRLLGAVPGRGVCIRPPETSPRRIERYAVEVGQEVLAAASSQLGRPYDWEGIIGIAAHRDWQETDSWFCSELAAWAFSVVQRPLLRADQAWRITPRDLLLSPLLQRA